MIPLLNRRRFHTALAAASASFASVHVSTGTARSASPNDQLGVAVVGVNSRGGEHIRGFNKDPRSYIRAIVDIDAEVGRRRADRVAELQGKRPAVVRDVRDALELDGVDIVSCATPNHWHALIGIWAMESGKDVYIEKPISHNIAEGRALVDAAERNGRMFQTGTQCRSSSGIADAMAYIAGGGIGRCDFARGLCYKRRKSIGAIGDYPIPAEVDFDLWSGPATFTDPKLTRKRFHYDWHWQRHYGNGDLGNQGPHQTDIARWGLGLDRHPTEILSYGGRLGYPAERNDPDYLDAGDTANTEVSIYDYGDKCIVFETRGLDVTDSGDSELNRLFGSSKGNKIGVVFYGERGYVVQRSYSQCVAYDKEFNVVKTFQSRGSVGDRHFSNFLDAVQSRDATSLHADALCGHYSAAVSHLGNLSYYLGEQDHATPAEILSAVGKIRSGDNDAETLERTVGHLRDNGVDLASTPLSLGVHLKFDADAERFIDNAAADRLLSRKRRPGYEIPAATTAGASGS